MSKKFLLIIMAVIVFLNFPMVRAHAEDSGIISIVEYEGDIYIYVRGISGVDSDSAVQIGNIVCESSQISAAAFDDLNPLMRTLVLVDNSQSIPNGNHDDINEIISGMVSNAKENEQISIATFSDEINYLCDYTSDHDELNEAAGQITYQNQDSYLSDVLYDVIAGLNGNDSYAFNRILVFSDGADDKSIGYTNSEVHDYIGKSQYPVYTVGVPAKNNSSELETMFSFSRAAKSDYFLLDGSVSNEDILNALELDKSGVCIKVKLDEEMKDGSNKGIRLRLNTPEGSIELTGNIDMPFGTGTANKKDLESDDGKQTEDKKTEEKPKEDEQEKKLPTLKVSGESTESPAKKDVEKKEAEKSNDNMVIILIIVISVFVIAVAVIVIVLLIVRSKKKKAAENSYTDSAQHTPAQWRDDSDESTELEGETVMEGADYRDDSAEELWNRRQNRNHLILQRIDNPVVMFKVPIEDVVSIGRSDTASIKLDDSKVSRLHCEIILRGNLLYIKDCNSKNKTYYENAIVHDEMPIISGGKVKIGEYIYRVELVKE